MSVQVPHSEKPPFRRSVRLIGTALILLIVLAGLELTSYIFLETQRDRYRWWFTLDIDAYVDSLPADQIEAFANAHQLGRLYGPDPEVGWTRVRGSQANQAYGTITTDELGSRASSAQGPISISTYGDSFTEGVAVDDEQTWQARLAKWSGTRVLNFGVSGYGPDQALLALEANLKRGVDTPVVLLAIIPENMNRLLNTFRYFYTHPAVDMTLGFKPIFSKETESFRVQRTIPENWADREAIRAAVWESSEHDYFYAMRTECIRFPCLVCAGGFLIRKGFWPPVEPSATSQKAVARLAYVLERFRDKGVLHGFTPVFVVLPQSGDEIASRGGKEHYFFGPLLRELELRGLVHIDVTQELSRNGAEAPVENFQTSRYLNRRHPSAYGNEAIARVLLSRLQDALAEVDGAE